MPTHPPRATAALVGTLVLVFSTGALAQPSAEFPAAEPSVATDSSLESFHGDVPEHVDTAPEGASPKTPHPSAPLTPSSSPVADPPTPGEASDDSLVHFTERIVSLQGVIGLGSIVGNLGVVGVLTPHERVSLVAGAGVTPWGVQWGASLRLRPYVWLRRKSAQAITIAPGFSMGPWEKMGDHLNGQETCSRRDDDDCGDGPFTSVPTDYYIRRIDRARWAQLDVGYELRTRWASVFAGPYLAMALNPEDCVVEGDVSEVKPCSEETTPLDRDSVPLAYGISAFVGF